MREAIAYFKFACLRYFTILGGAMTLLFYFT